MKSKIVAICLLIALLEGFAGLGVELYAIRISSTYIGSSISITGVILAVVLIAIAVGYWYGGRLSNHINTASEALVKAGMVLACSAFAHAIASTIQLTLLSITTSISANFLFSAFSVGCLFGVGLALGSTSIPLITQFLTLKFEDKEHVDAGKNAGMMVAITTIGSVLGSTLTPILLLPYIGLMASLAVFIVALSVSSILCTLLSKSLIEKPSGINGERKNYAVAIMSIVIALGFIITNKTDTGYQTASSSWFVKDVELEGIPATIIYNSPLGVSSCWQPTIKENCFWYGKIATETLESIDWNTAAFVGGAGMAIPTQVAIENRSALVTVIDIDKDIPDIAEEHVLKSPLPSNVTFIGEDARAYFRRNSDNKYDFVFLDAFQGGYVASNIFTVEGLRQIQEKSELVMANVIGAINPEHNYTQMILRNWVHVFGNESYLLTENQSKDVQNIILCNFNCGSSHKLQEQAYFVKQGPLHTDNMPRLDRYYYRPL